MSPKTEARRRKRNDALSASAVSAVTYYKRRIEYYYVYGIPAFLTPPLTVLVIVATGKCSHAAWPRKTSINVSLLKPHFRGQDFGWRERSEVDEGVGQNQREAQVQNGYRELDVQHERRRCLGGWSWKTRE
ncbi:hypothetical protein EJ04DRAFT_521711 [Polyplosphaeria fusca]|uniref:Uncharacterized protein n=1 Tax=Polyplosphaeria fusca TaxID=682080 RepID=A0A9P4QZW4_9PLEO|nr:hypothetical protein EJ04DRAFT_521711 [Polyplosphaeria fusca]